jgi:hypothetical protein
MSLISPLLDRRVVRHRRIPDITGLGGAFCAQAGIALALAFGTTLLLIRDDPRDAATAVAGTASTRSPRSNGASPPA